MYVEKVYARVGSLPRSDARFMDIVVAGLYMRCGNSEPVRWI